MNEVQIIALHTRLGFPGLDKTWVAAKRWATQNGAPQPSKEEVRAVISKRSTKQVFSKARHSGGQHVALGPGNFQADLASFQAVAGKRNKKFVHCLCLVSVWSRKLWARAIEDKNPETCRDALREILDNDMTAAEREGVKDLASDAGNEWSGAYRDFLAARGISQRIKDPQDRQGVAVIDRAVGSFKKIMYSDMQNRNSSAWYNRVVYAVKAYNERIHSAVGAPPGEVEGNQWLEHLLLLKNTRIAEANAAAWAKTKRGLEPGDKFRALLPKKQRGFQRAYRPVYGRQVLTVQGFRENGRKVVATDGSVHSVARVLPVPAGSVTTSFQALNIAERLRRQQVRAQRGGGE